MAARAARLVVIGSAPLPCSQFSCPRRGAQGRRDFHDTAEVEALFMELSLEAHRVTPRQIILDLDANDASLHGHQEGRISRGY
jgi:hypothetical protein